MASVYNVQSQNLRVVSCSWIFIQDKLNFYRGPKIRKANLASYNIYDNIVQQLWKNMEIYLHIPFHRNDNGVMFITNGYVDQK
jgi:hypothetical protein